MRARVRLFAIIAVGVFASACAKQVGDGGACFQSSECAGGSVCAATVYGNFCMTECASNIIFCDDGEACLRSSDLGAAGAGGAGGVGGMGGATGGAGFGGSPGEQVWVCLPGGEQLATDAVVTRDIGQLCDYSLECALGTLCVCIPGATCSGEGKNGPTCQRLCDPSDINQCPRVNNFQPECTALEDGRGFCDPTTLTVEPSPSR